jgi:hypothetical protein
MDDYKFSINKLCSYSQKRCPIRGNCVLCVQNHVAFKGHIPQCFQNLMRTEQDL